MLVVNLQRNKPVFNNFSINFGQDFVGKSIMYLVYKCLNVFFSHVSKFSYCLRIV